MVSSRVGDPTTLMVPPGSCITVRQSTSKNKSTDVENENEPARLTVTLREATMADVPALTKLINIAYLAEAHLKNGDRTSEQEVGGLIQNGPGMFWVGFINDEELVCGFYVQVSRSRCEADPEDKRVAYFGFLSIADEYQCIGMGSKIIEMLANIAKAQGLPCLQICALELRKELLEYYLRRGFVLRCALPFNIPQLRQKCDLLVLDKPL